jgi:hypothetical protein
MRSGLPNNFGMKLLQRRGGRFTLQRHYKGRAGMSALCDLQSERKEGLRVFSAHRICSVRDCLKMDHALAVMSALLLAIVFGGVPLIRKH